MQIDASLVQRLLYEEESYVLDFKQEQYPFAGASDEEKSELLKDVLAFANGCHRTDAFILTGVKEVKGGASTVIGISNDLDDAQLQQFVNSKTQRPVMFSYRAIPVRQVQVEVIHIPVQKRPIFLKKDYARLENKKVYVRRGTSTAVADPDEIAMMGSEDEAQHTTPTRPWVLIDGYSSELVQDEETGEPDLYESIHVVNRGEFSAANIVIPEIHLAGGEARLLRPLPTLGPGKGVNVRILNLRPTLQRVHRRMRGRLPFSKKGGPRVLRVPWVIEYRGLDHSLLTTEHVISFSARGISFGIAHPNDPRQWTDLSILEQEPARV